MVYVLFSLKEKFRFFKPGILKEKSSSLASYLESSFSKGLTNSDEFVFLHVR